MAVDEYCTLPPFTRQTLFCLSTQVNPFTTKCKHLNKKSIICCQFKDKAKELVVSVSGMCSVCSAWSVLTAARGYVGLRLVPPEAGMCGALLVPRW